MNQQVLIPTTMLRLSPSIGKSSNSCWNSIFIHFHIKRMMSGVFRVCESKFAGIHRKLVSHEKSLDFHKTSFKIHFLYFLVRRSFSSPRLPLTFCVACGCRSHRTLFCHHSHVLTTFQLSVRCQIRFWHSIERIIPFCCFFPSIRT